MGTYFFDRRNPSKFALLILPILFLIAGLCYSAASAPWGRQVDPEATYAMAGIAWADDGQMRKTDHPGTTTILLVGCVVRIAAWISGSPDVVEFGMKNFDWIIYASRATEVAILALVLLVSGVIVRNATRSAFAAVLFQIGPFAHFEVFHFETIVAPESLMISSAILGLALVIKAALGDRPPSLMLGALQGFVFSIGLSSKYLHLPLAAAGASLIRRPLALVIADLVAGFSFFLINLFLNVKVFTQGWHWLVALATHKGRYGGGDVGFVDLAEFWPNMVAVIMAAPLVSGIFAIGLVAATMRMCRTREWLDPISLTLVSLFVIFAAQLVATSKHFALHYMAASWVLVGGTLVLTMIELARVFGESSLKLVSGVAAIVAVALIVEPAFEVQREGASWAGINQNGERLSKAVLTAAPSCANVSSMFVSAPENELNFGVESTIGGAELRRYAETYARDFKSPLFDHNSYNEGELQRNFLPYSYRALTSDYRCIVVRTDRLLEASTSPRLFELRPDHCTIEAIQVYTVGIGCEEIQTAYKELNSAGPQPFARMAD